MSIKFDVKMTQKALFDFSLYTTYTSLNGIAGVLLGAVCVVLMVKEISAGDTASAVPFLLIAAFFLFGQPITMWTRAAEQVLKTPMFQKPLTYELNDDGVKVYQDDQSAENSWEDFRKAISTNKSIILFITKKRAIIFPKEALGEQYVAVVKMISANMPADKVKIRHVSAS